MFARFVEKKKKRILKVLVLVKIWSFFKKQTPKNLNFRYFFFDPTFFSAWNKIFKTNDLGDTSAKKKNLNECLIVLVKWKKDRSFQKIPEVDKNKSHIAKHVVLGKNTIFLHFCLFFKKLPLKLFFFCCI
jgi:hypothetical protein